ncbi:hypothetical protein SEA_COCOABERRY_72 [Mycobacterium phage Cocoaberry]|uniref:Uncharacterized protein n=17 Tax=Backyardiganvirus peaches TaxID=663557 RepID=A0A1L5C1E7_9CAUD|nr:hypothetical protein SEA_IRACEMA64_72 [Mycobacterium phage Iracema64]AEL19804.1 hypothetical protein MEEZEE_71 [Mycobacterium phage MeeZee]AJA43285.1 hypothetical protein PBI_GADOST_72 [Mycobacterium phage Gadost]ALF01129.1 hypothetical protein SEA_MAVERICK_71 [Mycobacterium phage Maverick]AOT25635.1 hypothetical protein SEA_COCOABERRY_72 [Mycobacterium phage Cocoaberry]APD17588.1 hypothetical protein PBI_PALESTINO_71 [Mycobacterium phage Palestino]APD17764.1 hypothetical protein PBI_ERIS_
MRKLAFTLAMAGIGVAIVATPPYAEAAPGMCANHGTGPGLIYKHACATGRGGWGWVDISETQQEYKSPSGESQTPPRVRDKG